MGRHYLENHLDRRIKSLERQLTVVFGGLICSWLALLAIALRFALRG